MKSRHSRRLIPLALVLALVACQPSDVHKVKVKLDDAAKILNTSARANHELYQAGVYGPVGSAGAIATRQKVATAIHAANEGLINALVVAKAINADNVGTSKADLLKVLGAAAQALSGVHIGNQKIDLAIQAAAILINDAVILVSQLKG